MTTDTRRLGVGVALLVVSTALVLVSALLQDVHVLDALGAPAALAMAAGALLVGLSEQGAGV